MGYMLIFGIFPVYAVFDGCIRVDGQQIIYGSDFESFIKYYAASKARKLELVLSVLNQTMIFDHGKLIAWIGIITSLVLSINGVAVILKGLNQSI